MIKLNSLITGVLLGSVILFAGPAAAQVSSRTLRFAHQNTLEHPQGQGVKKFADRVEQKSGGKIMVRAFPGGQLGGDLQTVSALQGGTIDLTVLNAGLLVGVITVVPDFAAAARAVENAAGKVAAACIGAGGCAV